MRTISNAFLIIVTVVSAVVMAAIWNKIPAAFDAAGEFALLSLRTCGMVLISIVAVAAFWVLARQAHERNRQRDGAWAIREYQLLPLTARILNTLQGRPSPKAIYDPNGNPMHHAIIYRGVHVQDASPEQYAYAIAQEGANKLRAVNPGDAALSLPWVDMPSRSPMNAPTARLMAGAYDKPVRQIEAKPENPTPAPPAHLSLEDAMTQHTPAKWLLGQNRGTGDLAIWTPESNPHIAIVGASGSGKTESSVMHLITASRLGPAARRWHCVILDPVGGADLRPFANKTEWHDTTPDIFTDQLRAVASIMAERKALCNAGNVARVSDLPDAPRQIMLLIDEFGLLMSDIKGAAQSAAAVILEDIVRVGRKWGVHLALCDQDKSRWPQTLADGVSPTLTYRMADYGGARTKAYAADMLAPGQFVMGRRVYDAWHVAPRLGEILAAMPGQKARVIDGVRAERSQGGDTPRYTSEQLPNTVHEQSDEQTVNTSALPIMDRDTWYAWALDYMATVPSLWQSPPRGVREMARAMSRHATGNDAGEGSYVGLASELCRRVREESNVGTDISVEVQP